MTWNSCFPCILMIPPKILLSFSMPPVYTIFPQNLVEAKQKANLFLHLYVPMLGLSPYFGLLWPVKKILWWDTVCKDTSHTDCNSETGRAWLVTKFKCLSHSFKLNYLCCTQTHANVRHFEGPSMWTREFLPKSDYHSLVYGADKGPLGSWQKN